MRRAQPLLKAAIVFAAALFVAAGWMHRAARAEPPPVDGSPTVEITFRSTPAGAAIISANDRKLLGVTPIAVPVRRGEVAVLFQLKKEGYRVSEVPVRPNENQVVAIELVPLDTPKETPPAPRAPTAPVRTGNP